MRIKSLSTISLWIVCLVLLMSVSCVFSPKSGKKEDPVPPKTQIPLTTQIVIENLQAAFNLRDAELYEKTLHEDFYYQYTPEYDDHSVIWTRTEEIEAIRNMFAQTKDFVLTPSLISIQEEYGQNMKDIPPGAAIDSDDEHPDEKWIICNYYITMDIFLSDLGDFKVQQDMKFKMVEDPVTHYYSIIRWVDDALITE